MKGYVALEDGTIFTGRAFGASTTVVGEIVFNTAMTGYQEVLTDPSYYGQMVVMTVPHVGNVGVNPEDEESPRPWLRAFLVRSLSPVVSNWRARESLDAYLQRHGIPGLAEVNTRALTLRIRERGALKAALSTDPTVDPQALVEQARAWPGLDGRDVVRFVTTPTPYTWDEPGLSAWYAHGATVAPATPRPHIVVVDFGVKRNILRRLVAHGAHVTVVPATTSAADILARRPDGVVLSNGPGDPAALPYAIRMTQALLARGLPLLGICLGHQLLGLALGGRTYKLPFGHHGGNQPVQHTATGRVGITAQNHNYAVSPDGLPPQAHITYWNLNDQTVEGLALTDRPVLGVQYHPEASPGPHDMDTLFRDFLQMVRQA